MPGLLRQRAHDTGRVAGHADRLCCSVGLSPVSHPLALRVYLCLQLNDDYYECLTKESTVALLDACRAGKPPAMGTHCTVHYILSL